jgi:prepilin-type N-terminal cleavage/methylation domain-containing protein
MRRSRGFTLIELMIVVAIIGILAAIAIPKFADLIRKSQEGAGKGDLGAIRGSLAIYYGEMEGQYPSALGSLTMGGKYISKIPGSRTPNYHADSTAVNEGSGVVAPTDDGGWFYNMNASSPFVGDARVDCTHTDTKGTIWSSY